MANGLDLKNLTKSRLKTTRSLIRADEWDVAAYMMGYALETALKAATCRALRVEQYPDFKSHKNDKIVNYFMTHNFDQLLLVSGLTDIFSVDGLKAAFNNWSLFTQQYSGEWTAMRYISGKFNKEEVEKLYGYLYEDQDSILKTMTGKRRW